MNILLYIFCIIFVDKSLSKDLYEVVCPAFEEEDDAVTQRSYSKMKSSENEFCQCSLSQLGPSNTAIVKCDFDSKKDVILKKSIFPFLKNNVTSAYVRMRNAKSTVISGGFLSSWMDAPSSALDLWQCGDVSIEPTPQPHPLQIFTDLKTFVGVGIIDCRIKSLPALFLRDRSRGAFRLKGCEVGRINAGLFHNVEEVRYLNFEDTVVKEVAGPLSSSGVVTLSRREIHSWDGVEFVNSSFNYIAPYSFNITHLNEMEKFNIFNCSFGKLEKGAVSATGDIDVLIRNSSFDELESMSIQVSVKGKLAFTNNVVKSIAMDSLMGMHCANDSTLDDNIIHVHSDAAELTTRFAKDCGTPQVSYIVAKPDPGKNKSSTSTVITVLVVMILLAMILFALWGWRRGILMQYMYKRGDTPLWREERTPDGGEDPIPIERDSSILRNPVFSNVKTDT